MIDVSSLTIDKVHEHLVCGDFSVKELVDACLSQGRKHASLNAYLEIYGDIEGEIKRAQREIDTKKEKADVLTGIPLAIKDNILVEEKKISCGSKILEGYSATYDAHVIAELKKRGVIFLGRTNMDEFAMGSSTENSAFGTTKNPYDEKRVAGGSSGGSAAVVSFSGALGALGSDTGGSIRQPAAFCGVVGLKSTYGSVSRNGLVALASSLDQIGPFAKNVGDTRILFNAISSYDPKDSTSYNEKTRKKMRLDVSSKKKIGVPRHLFKEGVDEDVLANFEETLSSFKSIGYEIVDIELPSSEFALSAYYIILPAEASSNLARFDGVRFGLHKNGNDMIGDYGATRGEGFGIEVRRRILLGTYVLSAGYYDAYYNKAIAVREKISEEFLEAFESVDVIMTPTTPTPAFKIGEKTENPLAMYLSDIFTVSSNITGTPALSVPSGFVERDGKKLPVALQIMAPHFGEEELFKIGCEYEGLRDTKDGIIK
ncbi:MAG: Asp-tRNA(Asn)/Glu-tRNA(Gln) amidotransferase subunit GatA [Candidatus Paceibacterota bacterium]